MNVEVILFCYELWIPKSYKHTHDVIIAPFFSSFSSSFNQLIKICPEEKSYLHIFFYCFVGCSFKWKNTERENCLFSLLETWSSFLLNRPLTNIQFYLLTITISILFFIYSSQSPLDLNNAIGEQWTMNSFYVVCFYVIYL